MRRVASGVAAAAVIMTSACAPAAKPAPSPSPAATTYTCIDDGLRKAGECSKDDYDKQQAEQAQFAEAQRVYKAFMAERARLSHAGGSTTPTPVMSQYAEGAYLDEISKYLSAQAAQKRQATGDWVLSNFKIERSKTMAGADFAMAVCEDGRGVEQTDKAGKSLGGGRLARAVLFFRGGTSQTKIFDWDAKEAQSCTD